MSYNMSNVLGIIFANSHDESLPELSSNRTMGSVPFGGRFRLIDFQLSSMVNSGMTTVGIITKSNYQSLLDHVGSGRQWDLARSDGGLTILPPYGRTTGLYNGKLEAIKGAMGYIVKTPCEYVVLCDCNVVASEDLSKVVDAHIESGADITCVTVTGDYTAAETADAFCFETFGDGRVSSVIISPAKAGHYTMGLGVIILKKQQLIDLVDDLVPRGKCDFGKDVLQAMTDKLNIRTYEYTGYYRRICDLESYYDANMDLLNAENLEKLILKKRPVYTKVRDDAPSKYGLDSSVNNSLVADGCVIDGIVENSILFRGVKVAKGAVVKNCILMQDTEIGKSTEISNIITDKNVKIGDELCISSAEGSPLYISKKRVL